MALKARKWSALDRAFVEYIRDELTARGLSLRKIESATGISRGRIDGMLHMTAGTPTLEEFIALTDLVGENPADVLSKLNSGQRNQKTTA